MSITRRTRGVWILRIAGRVVAVGTFPQVFAASRNA